MTADQFAQLRDAWGQTPRRVGSLRSGVPAKRSMMFCVSTSNKSDCATSLALLWQILSNVKVIAFPNQFFNDSWVVGLWRADHGENDEGLGSRA